MDKKYHFAVIVILLILSISVMIVIANENNQRDSENSDSINETSQEPDLNENSYIENDVRLKRMWY